MMNVARNGDVVGINDIFQITWQFYHVVARQLGEMTCHYQCAGTASERLGDVIINFANTAIVNLLPTMSSLVLFAGLYGRFEPLKNARGTAQCLDDGADLGSSSLGDLPRQTAGLIHKHNPSSYRGGAGRAFVPFPAQDMIDGVGQPNSTYTGAVQAFAHAMAGTIITSGGTTLQAGIYEAAKPKRVPPLLVGVFHPVSSGTVSPFWATQRRRGDLGEQNLGPQ